LLLIRDSVIIRTRERSQNFENRRQRVFEASTLRESFLFERVETKTTDLQEEKIASKMKHAIQRADPASRRERGREREREQERERERERERARERNEDERAREERIDINETTNEI
jgi:zinc finger CCCH domain-containing protein 13